MNQTKKAWWKNRTNQALMAFLAIGGYLLWTGHQAHVIAALPWLLLGGCLVMHLFMHGGHGHHGRGHGAGNSGRRDEE